MGRSIAPLRPVLVVTLLHAISGSARVSFLGIWAIDELDASLPRPRHDVYLAAIAAVGTGFLGGHLSDHIGRRPLILCARPARPPWRSRSC